MMAFTSGDDVGTLTRISVRDDEYCLPFSLPLYPFLREGASAQGDSRLGAGCKQMLPALVNGEK